MEGVGLRGKITKRAVDALKPGAMLADVEIKGFVARKLPSGLVSYGLRYRVAGKQRWLSLGLHGRLTPEGARRFAKIRAGEIADDRDPVAEREAEHTEIAAPSNNAVDAVLDSFVERHVRRNLRSADEVERIFNKYVRPRFGTRSIYDLRRSDIVAMLDEIEDQNGPVMADRALAHLRKAFNWRAARDDIFVPPIVRGMTRTSGRDRARTRVLDDQEVRDLWSALDMADVHSCYPAYVRSLFLTAQRRTEVAEMRWEELEGKVWTIPGQRRKQGDSNSLLLCEPVLRLLGTSKRSGFVFSTTNGRRAFSGFSKAKRALDRAISELRQREGRAPMARWVLHDLRRTARSLMSRAGVLPDIGERVIGHVIPGVRGVYDRHSYLEEKGEALARLFALIADILQPSDVAVAPLSRATARRASTRFAPNLPVQN
jgi:integrase